MYGHTKHRSIVFGVVATALTATFAAAPSATSLAQESLPIVGINAAASRDGLTDQVEAFLTAMQELGYHDGQNVRYEFRFADGDAERRGPNAQELVDLNPAAIVTVGPVTVPDLKALTSTIPIVVGFANPTAMAEHVQNFEHPEGNITGRLIPAFSFAQDSPVLAKELVPEATVIGYMQGSGANAEANIETMNEAAGSLGLSVVVRQFASVEEVVPAYEALVAEGVDVVVGGGGPIMIAALPDVSQAATTARIPTIYAQPAAVSHGGLMTVSADQITPLRTSAELVDRILKGASPADLPIVQSGGHLIRVNLAAAEAIGLTVPDSILARANEVIDD